MLRCDRFMKFSPIVFGYIFWTLASITGIAFVIFLIPLFIGTLS